MRPTDSAALRWRRFPRRYLESHATSPRTRRSWYRRLLRRHPKLARSQPDGRGFAYGGGNRRASAWHTAPGRTSNRRCRSQTQLLTRVERDSSPANPQKRAVRHDEPTRPPTHPTLCRGYYAGGDVRSVEFAASPSSLTSTTPRKTGLRVKGWRERHRDIADGVVLRDEARPFRDEGPSVVGCGINFTRPLIHYSRLPRTCPYPRSEDAIYSGHETAVGNKENTAAGFIRTSSRGCGFAMGSYRKTAWTEIRDIIY